MHDSHPSYLAARDRYEPIQLVAAVVAGLAAMSSAANLAWLSDELPNGWASPAVAVALAAGGYLALTGLAHASQARLPQTGQSRGDLWLASMPLVLAWFIMARGPASRLLLTGLATTASALAASSGVSLLVAIRARLVLAQPVELSRQDRARSPWTAWRCVAAAAMLLSVLYLETRPLPEIKPWEQAVVSPAREKPHGRKIRNPGPGKRGGRLPGPSG